MSISELHTNLVRQLQPIAAKRTADDKRFTLSWDGSLALGNKVSDCFEALVELFCRFVMNKTGCLRKKFTSITADVEKYLSLETDEKRRSEFLNTFTPALNEMYRAAGRMKQAGLREFAENPDIAPTPNISKWVIAPIDERTTYMNSNRKSFHPFHASASLTIQNQSPYAIECTQDGLSRFSELWYKTIAPQGTLSSSSFVEFKGDSSFSVAVSRKHTTSIDESKNYRIIINESGDISVEETNEPPEEGMFRGIRNTYYTIVNQSSRELDLNFWLGHSVVMGPSRIAPHTTVKHRNGINIPSMPIAQHVPVTIEWSLKRETPISLGCAYGDYLLKVNRQGNVEFEVHARPKA